MKSLVLLLLFLFVSAPAEAFERGDTVPIGIVCKGPDIVKSITNAAETSIEEAGELIYAAEATGVCVFGVFQATLEEKTGRGVSVDGSVYELWTISGNNVIAYTYLLFSPSI
jgi:hypothetical protein